MLQECHAPNFKELMQQITVKLSSKFPALFRRCRFLKTLIENPD
jgi:hypothetical protein